MSFRNHKHAMILLLILINLSAITTGQPSCTSNGNYTLSATYTANLNALLSSLSSNITPYGFHTSSVGQSPDRASALALCQADLTPDQCRSCIQSAAPDLLRSCRNQRQGVMWNSVCTVLYSNDDLRGIQDRFMIFNAENVSSGNLYFKEDVVRLLADLRVQAANGSSALKVGAGSRFTMDFGVIYGLQQCAPDLSSQECRNCLDEMASDMPERLDLARGVRMLAAECNLRYEAYPFYNETRLRELQVLPPLPPPPSRGVGGGSDDNTCEKKDTKTRVVVILILVPTGVFLLPVACVVTFRRKRIERRTLLDISVATDEISSVESLQYDFDKIRDATNNFEDANKLGQGGFGAVYRGKLQSGQEIAVKRLSKDSSQGDTEFKNEVLLVARLQHRNLAKLLGFSLEGRERLLVYEFVQNASLDKFLFDPNRLTHLDWSTRYKIIGGVARGLLYLHEDSRLRIIHRDLKASNVLLDGDMNPKIADFGMARLFKQDETQGDTSRIVGTYGYMAPEYAMHGRFSIKSDVFSFGVLILEIVSGQRNTCIRRGENVENLLTLTWENWRDGTAEDIIDPVLKNGVSSVQEVLRCVHIGLLCVQENASNRPTMTSVVIMLNSDTISLPVPSQPAFYTASRYGPDGSIFQVYDSGTSGIEDSSKNSISITELYPR